MLQGKFSTGQKLACLVMLLLGFMMLIGISGRISQQNILQDFSSTYQDRVIPLKQLKVIADRYAVDIVDSTHKLRANTLSAADTLRGIEHAQSAIREHWQHYQATKLTPEEARLAGELAVAMQRANLAVTRLQHIIRQQDQAGLQQFAEHELYPAIEPVSAIVSQLVDLQLSEAEREFQQAQQSAQHYAQLSLLLLCLAALASSIFAYVLIRRLLHRLGGEPHTVAHIAQRIAEGDLTQAVQGTHRPDSITGAIHLMQNTLRQLLSHSQYGSQQLAQAAQQLHSGSTQIHAASQQQSEAASQAAAAIEELSASIEAVKERAHATHHAIAHIQTISDNSQQQLNTTAHYMQTVTTSMSASLTRAQQLDQRSQAIDHTLALIRDIADQTNLLALNAAIEAARAGEQGRGFAVVADEVRKLAERTASSTHQISGVMQDIRHDIASIAQTLAETSSKLEQGRSQTDAVCQDIQALQHTISSVGVQAQGIFQALEEQSHASIVLAKNIEHIASMAEETSQATTQATVATDELHRLSHSLQQQMGQFRLAGG